MKKVLSLFLSLFMLFNSVLFLNAEPISILEQGNCGEDATYIIYSDYSMVISGEGDIYDYELDDSISEYYSSIKSVTINQGISSIGSFAFANFESLTSFSLASSVETIGVGAFALCTSLKNVYIPSTVAYISEYVFEGCDNIESLSVDNDNPIYDSRNNCNGIVETDTNTLIQGCKNTVLDNSIVVIGYGSFAGLSSLNSILLPSSISEIEDYAFAGSSIEEIIIPNSVETIGIAAFVECSDLTSVTIADSVNEIGDNAFAGCSSLSSIVLPDNLVSIGNYLFDGCFNLKNIVLSENITTIGDGAFNGCTALNDLTFVGDCPTIASDAFSGVKATIYYPKNNTSYTSNKKKNYGGSLSWQNYEIYNITYHLDGGINDLDNPVSYKAIDDEFVLLSPSRAGYTFRGWYLENSYTNRVTSIVPSDYLKDLDLYAKFEYTPDDYVNNYLSINEQELGMKNNNLCLSIDLLLKDDDKLTSCCLRYQIGTGDEVHVWLDTLDNDDNIYSFVLIPNIQDLDKSVNISLVVDDVLATPINISFKDYLDDNNSDNKIMALIEYNKYVNNYFEKVGDVSLIDSSNVQESLRDNSYKIVSSKEAKNIIRLNSTSLVIDNNLSLKVYLDVVDNSFDLADFSYLLNGQVSDDVVVGDDYILVKDIGVDEYIKLNIKYNGVSLIEFTYSPIIYIKQVLKQTDSKYNNLKNLVVSMYEYNETINE